MSHQNFLLSVVVPIFRMQGRLGYLQDWLLKSTDYDLQVVLVHDRSEDLTGLELERIINDNQLSNVTLVEGLYGSPGGARNAGLEFCTGKWLAFWDSDDIPHLETIFSFLINSRVENPDFIVGSYSSLDLTNGQTQCHELSPEQKPGSLLMMGINPGLWRYIFSRNVIGTVKFPETRMAEDQSFLTRIFTKTSVFKVTSELFYTYHTGFPNQLTSRKDAIEDLPKSLEATATEQCILKELSVVRQIMVYRQLATGLRLCSFRGKIVTLNYFFSFQFKTKRTWSEGIQIVKLIFQTQVKSIRLGS